jgi:hypothetical protein
VVNPARVLEGLHFIEDRVRGFSRTKWCDMSEKLVQKVKREFTPTQFQWQRNWIGPTIGCYCPMCKRYRELRDAKEIK